MNKYELWIDDLVSVILGVAQGNYDVSCKLEWGDDKMEALSVGINIMIENIKDDVEKKERYLTALAEKNAALDGFARALEKSEKQHRIFFEKSQGFYCTHDLKGNFISVNLAGAESIHYKPEELIGVNLRDIIAPSYKHLFKDYLKAIGEQKVARGLMQVLTKGGEQRTWLYYNYLYEDASTSFVIGSAQDITDRVKMEFALRRAKMQVEESEKIKEQFLANTSHEIRTPMNAILGFTNLLLKTELTGEQQEYLTIINDSGQNLLVIINDILDLSKLRSDKLTFEEIDFDFSDLVRSVMDMFGAKAMEKNIELISHIETNVPLSCKGDPGRIKQVLINLLSNAMKFTDSGYVRLTVKLLEQTANKDTLELSVEDSGIGIAEDKLETIFDNFTQASSDTTRKYGGTGLGLSIVKNIIELQGGKIRAVRGSERGTIFIFTLPLKKAEIRSVGSLNKLPAKEKENEWESLKNVKILLVEDNKINQRLAQIVLNKKECQVDIVNNGAEALEILKTSWYDIILMDLQMPEMDGYETTKIIRSNTDENINTIPIIAMTAHAMSDEMSKCIQAGMDDYISKPFNPNVLYEKIAFLISFPAKG